MKKNTEHCSFCGRSREEVKILVCAEDAYICESCTAYAQEVIEQEIGLPEPASLAKSKKKAHKLQKKKTFRKY